METKQQTKEAPKQAGKRPAFCLRLNTFRALSCLSVIFTHIVSFSGLIDEFQTFHFAGHQAVYFFFNLSGYLLSLSLIKEVKRRVSAHKKVPVSDDEEKRLVSNQSGQLELDNEQPTGYQTVSPQGQGGFSLIGGIKQIQKSLLACIIGKYLWNRTWKTFPMYFGAWLILKGVSHPGTKVESLDPNITWGQIFGLKVFPGHLWTMRIDMIFYFYVVPVYVCLLYAAFKLQKAGFKLLSKIAFGGIVAGLLATAIYNMVSADKVFHPFALEDYFFPCLPPFCFGMIAGLINFALEKRITARQAANAQEPREAIEEQDDSLVGKVKSFFTRNLYSIIFTAVFLRIVFLNPGIIGNTHAKSPIAPLQVANLHSYWYGIFILINDTRGGFWKYMHPVEAKPTALHPSALHKVVYYFGLWSYAIYLTHPVSYDTLKRLLPAKSFHTVEFWTGSIILAFGLGIIVDYVFDKFLTDKIIQGKIFKNLGKVIAKKQREQEAAKVSTP